MSDSKPPRMDDVMKEPENEPYTFLVAIVALLHDPTAGATREALMYGFTKLLDYLSTATPETLHGTVAWLLDVRRMMEAMSLGGELDVVALAALGKRLQGLVALSTDQLEALLATVTGASVGALQARAGRAYDETEIKVYVEKLGEALKAQEA